jgi:flagellar biosynthetic protein FliR
MGQFSLTAFLMIISRMTGMMLTAPVFSSRQVPRMIKITVVLVISGLMSFYIPVDSTLLTSDGLLIIAVILEFLVGYLIGWISYLIFGAVQLAGQLIDMQLGFGMVNVLDPQSGIQVPLTGNFIYLLALIVYLNLDGHHYLFEAIARSYQTLPVLGWHMSGGLMELLLRCVGDIFIIAGKIAMPVIIALLISELGMGFIARTVPQMNIFVVGMSLKILLGLMVLFMIMPAILWFFSIMVEQFFDYIYQLLLILR